jgi:hypothetical protein
MELCMFQTVPLSMFRCFSLYTQQRYMSYSFTDTFSRIRMEHSEPAWKLSTNLYDIYHCCVYSKNSWWWTKELSEICRVPFQNKFEKSVHLVGFIIRICRDAQSHEHKIQPTHTHICTHTVYMKSQQISQPLLIRSYLPMHQIKPPHSIEE